MKWPFNQQGLFLKQAMLFHHTQIYFLCFLRSMLNLLLLLCIIQTHRIMHSFPFFSLCFFNPLSLSSWREDVGIEMRGPHISIPRKANPPYLTHLACAILEASSVSSNPSSKNSTPLKTSDWRTGGELVPRRNMCWNLWRVFFSFSFPVLSLSLLRLFLVLLRSMDSRTHLDYILFQLTPTRTR